MEYPSGPEPAYERVLWWRGVCLTLVLGLLFTGGMGMIIPMFLLASGSVALAAQILGAQILALLIALAAVRVYVRAAMRELAYGIGDAHVHVRQGVWIKSDRRVPLDRIQDVTIVDGAFLRRVGLRSLRIQTAAMGGSNAAEARFGGILHADALAEDLLRRAREARRARD